MFLRNRYSKIFYPTIETDNVVSVFAYDSSRRRLEVVGKKDRNAFVDSFRELCSIKNKLIRFQNGDITALNVKKGIFADISGIPTDYNTLHNTVKTAMNVVKENGFDSIPAYIQSLIDLNTDVKTENNTESEVIENE